MDSQRMDCSSSHTGSASCTAGVQGEGERGGGERGMGGWRDWSRGEEPEERKGAQKAWKRGKGGVH